MDNQEALERCRAVTGFLVRSAGADIAASVGEVDLAARLRDVGIEPAQDIGEPEELLEQVTQAVAGDPRRVKVVLSALTALRYTRFVAHLVASGLSDDNSVQWAHRAADSVERAARTMASGVLDRRHGPLLPGTYTEVVAMLMSRPAMPAWDAVRVGPVLGEPPGARGQDTR